MSESYDRLLESNQVPDQTFQDLNLRKSLKSDWNHVGPGRRNHEKNENVDQKCFLDELRQTHKGDSCSLNRDNYHANKGQEDLMIMSP